jgi:hypothetical protein
MKPSGPASYAILRLAAQWPEQEVLISFLKRHDSRCDLSDEQNEPIRLVEDENTGDRFLIYSTERGAKLDIRFEGDTLWMTQAQIADLFGRDRTTITRHINNVLEEGELDEPTSVQKMHTSHGRPAAIYSLDMVISVGYRVSSAQATLFRRWATSILVQYAKKGFVIDAPRLKEPGNIDRVRELREIIRDIRASEANLYAELRDICAMCQDYDGSEATSREFYAHIQAKLVYAVASMTPSELVHSRANHREEHMGLQNWPNENIRKSDVVTSKNYLAEREIRELNRLTEILLSIFEDQLELERLVTMNDARRLLDEQLRNLGRTVLTDGGQVSHAAAKNRAYAEYTKFDQARREKRKEVADAEIAALKAESKKLPRTR